MDFLNPRSPSAAERFHALFEPNLSNPLAASRNEGPDVPHAIHEDRRQDPTGKSRGSEMSWVAYVDLYLQRLENRYTSDYPRVVRLYLERFTEYRGLHAARLGDIHSIDIEQYLSDRRRDRNSLGEPLSERTLNNEISALNACFAFAGPKDRTRDGRKHLNWLAEPPYCEKLSEPGLDPVKLSNEQIQAFIRATAIARSPNIEGCSPQDFWVCVLILDSLTLLRRKALLMVERPDDDMLLVRKQLFIPAAINKTKEDVYVTLGTDDTIPRLFAKLPTKPGERLLPWRDNTGRPLTLNYFSEVIRQFQREAGIPDGQRLKLKHLRSTSANRVEEATDESTAKSKLKHGPNTNTYRKHYRSRQPSAKEVEATDSLTSWLFGMLKTSDEVGGPDLRVFG